MKNIRSLVLHVKIPTFLQKTRNKKSNVTYTQSLIQAPHISNTFETGQNLGKIKQLTGVFKKKIEKISNNSNTSKQR